ncbi:hypothetical protein BGW80DRAFT_1428160, partial [Lactifluus volemus]
VRPHSPVLPFPLRPMLSPFFPSFTHLFLAVNFLSRRLTPGHSHQPPSLLIKQSPSLS